MEENSRVTVKIYGQEYTIAGGSSGEQIVIVANHVDSMMNELAKGLPSMPVSSLAVLTAVNITNDFFEAREKISELEGIIADLRKDADHYIQLWEDAKASFKQYKEDAQNSVEQLQELQRIFNMKNIELNKANETAEELQSRCNRLEGELEELQKRYDQRGEEMEKTASARSEDADETLRKYKELESSFFDIQMENIHLKNELDNLKKSGM